MARAAGLLALGALVVHELRYLLAYGDGAERALAAHGHGYLVHLAPALVAFAAALVAAGLLAGVARRARGAPRGCARPVPLLYGVALLAVFAVQELAEGALLAGHADGLAAVLHDGGWVALPVSLAVGALVALLARGLDRVEETIASALRSRRLLPLSHARPREAAGREPLAARALAFGLARRPPPALPIG